MKTLPRIGILTLTAQDGVHPPFHATRRTYIESVLAAGGAPLLIPLIDSSPEALRTIYDLCTGLLFCGGKDIAPAHYKETPLPQCDEPDSLRDSVELTVLRWALNESKPVLGICRGCQLMNIACGGSLIQDLPTQRPEAQRHADGFPKDPKALYNGRHLVNFEKGSQIAGIFGVESLVTNTVHHQAVKEVGLGLAVTATSEDGIVEGIEYANHPFAIGLQWHPELQWQSESRVHLNPFIELVAAASRGA